MVNLENHRNLQETEESDQSTDADENDSSGGSVNSDIDVKTVEALEQSIRNLASMDGIENVYVEIPDLHLDKIIVSNKEVHDRCREAWSDPDDAELLILLMPSLQSLKNLHKRR